jgi:hypothetical protein
VIEDDSWVHLSINTHAREIRKVVRIYIMRSLVLVIPKDVITRRKIDPMRTVRNSQIASSFSLERRERNDDRKYQPREIIALYERIRRMLSESDPVRKGIR